MDRKTLEALGWKFEFREEDASLFCIRPNGQTWTIKYMLEQHEVEPFIMSQGFQEGLIIYYRELDEFRSAWMKVLNYGRG